VFDDNYLKDVSLGTHVIDIRQLLLLPTSILSRSFPLTKTNPRTHSSSPNGSVFASIQFLQAVPGLVRVKLNGGRGLVEPDRGGTADPYVRFDMLGTTFKNKNKKADYLLKDD